MPRNFRWPSSRSFTSGFGGWALVFALTVLLGEAYVRGSTPAALALQFAQHDPVIQHAVGGVEDARLAWIANIRYAGPDGWASFKMHVKGAKSNGIMDVTVVRKLGKWNVAGGRLITDSGQVVTIDGPLPTLN